jgi:hypothetical protein
VLASSSETLLVIVDMALSRVSAVNLGWRSVVGRVSCDSRSCVADGQGLNEVNMKSTSVRGLPGRISCLTVLCSLGLCLSSNTHRHAVDRPRVRTRQNHVLTHGKSRGVLFHGCENHGQMTLS